MKSPALSYWPAAACTLIFGSCKKNVEATTDTTSTDLATLGYTPADTVGISNVQMCTVLYPKGSDPRAAIMRYKKWTNGSTLTVKLSGGTSYIREQVVKYANYWSDYANIKFKFVTSGDADIRVTFDAGGSYSYLGTDALNIPSTEETMNFGWYTNRTSSTEFRRVIVHEFGHALGLIHEQQHPLVDIPWDKPKVYAYYARTQGWSKSQVDVNLFTKTDISLTQYNAYDPTSIMHYSVSNALTIGDFEVGNNTDLSANDTNFISKVYPK